MKSLIARLIRPFIEEAISELYVERAQTADAHGICGLDRIFFTLLGDDPQAPQSDLPRPSTARE